MWCLDLVGREIWDWDGPLSVIEHEPFPRMGCDQATLVCPLAGRNGSALNKMVVVVVEDIIIIIYIIVVVPQPRHFSLELRFPRFLASFFKTLIPTAEK